MEFEPIMRLSDAVIGQIAAGEVVERPASAVKELVENSIDAGATAVTVELKNGGIGYLRVSDNGRGIPAGQVRMAFERHATSKLRKAEELFSVRTLGFRGEALASIAAVSKVTCITRTADADYGIKTHVEAGTMGEIVEAASPIGTTITMRDLFFNAPVRLKFLKKPTAEAALVSDYMMRLILSKPNIAFRFVNEGKTIYRSAGDGTLESAIYCVYGREALQAMYPIKGVQSGVVLEGYVGVGEQSRGNRLQQSFFINGRYFRSEALGRALERGCEGYVMIGRFPSCVLMLTMPYHQVDVNVHPNKLEVRFQNPDAVAQAITALTGDALRTVTIQEKLAGETKADMVSPEQEIKLMAWREGMEDELADATQQHAVQDADTQRECEPRENPIVPELYGMPGINDPSWGSVRNDGLSKQEQPSSSPPILREPAAMPHSAEEMLIQRESVQWIPESVGEDEADHADDTVMPVTASTDESMVATTVPESNMSWTTPQGSVMRFHRTGLGDSQATEGIPERETDSITYTQEAFAEPDDRITLRYIGAAFRTYLLFEAGERLLMVDQHAAHERVLFDRFLARYDTMTISQQLMTPQMIRLTARDVSTLSDMEETLVDSGFEVEVFDATSVAVRAVPVILGETEDLRDVLLDVLDEQQAARGKATRERMRRHVAQLACKHAIKAGDILREEDVRLLLEQMLSTGAQPTCPHGRPIVIEIPRRELEKRFKRIQ